MADIVLLATADWDHPLWTNKQHVATALVKAGHRVLYINSLGLRNIQPTMRDLQRTLKRLWYGLRPPRSVKPDLWVWSPLVIPGGFMGIGLIVNRLSLHIGLYINRRLLHFQDPWLWTFNPLAAHLLNLKDFRVTIYHAVDALQEQPCMPSRLIAVEERRLCGLVDQVLVTSPQLQRQLETWSQRIRYDPNVADQGHFSKAMAVSSIPDDLKEIPEPRIGFIGAVSSYKLDFALIAALANCHPYWSFVFIGPTGEGEIHTDTQPLDAEPNVYLLGWRPYSSLPNYCAGFSCGWLPLRLTPYTKAMFPMKFFEYLAAGLPVVATYIDSLKKFSDVALLCKPTTATFSLALDTAITGGGPPLSTRLTLASEHTYAARTQCQLVALEALQAVGKAQRRKLPR
ncbi:glycosyltransferase family 1 protein [cyanobiont of Ornithocercus magnificus]|nr:glycosyltransferase family 1 protein [cyanobiont of Ornithocercus magnificus]